MLDRTTSEPQIRVEHQGEGLTIETTISIGGKVALRYLPGTSHLATADEIASSFLAAALENSLRSVVPGFMRVDTDYYGSKDADG